MNESKKYDPRMWAKWKKAGALADYDDALWQAEIIEFPVYRTAAEFLASGDETWYEFKKPAVTPLYEFRDIPLADEPKVIFLGEAEKYSSSIEVDLPLISRELLKFGFSERLASTYAIVFHHENDLIGDENVDVGGWYNGLGHHPRIEDQLISHPLAVHVVLPQPEGKLNNTLRHELGHAHQDNVMNELREPLYANDETLARTRTIGSRTIAGGALTEAASVGLSLTGLGNFYVETVGMATGLAGMAAGTIMNKEPRLALWQIDGGEQYARKFAHKHKQFNPIKISS